MMGGRYLQNVRIMHSFFIHEQWAGVRAVSQVLSMWPCIRELDKETSGHAGLVQQNGFGLAFPQSIKRLVKGIVNPNSCC
jgi:hypothetical protein